jgi:hypothetical protein
LQKPHIFKLLAQLLLSYTYFRENFRENKYFHANSCKHKYFREHFRENLPKYHVIKIFPQKWSFVSYVADTFGLYETSGIVHFVNLSEKFCTFALVNFRENALPNIFFSTPLSSKLHPSLTLLSPRVARRRWHIVAERGVEPNPSNQP